jgi:hypothetical protein
VSRNVGGHVARSEGGVGCRGWRVVGVDGEEVGCGSIFVVVSMSGNVLLVNEDAGYDEPGCGVRKGGVKGGGLGGNWVHV